MASKNAHRYKIFSFSPKGRPPNTHRPPQHTHLRHFARVHVLDRLEARAQPLDLLRGRTLRVGGRGARVNDCLVLGARRSLFRGRDRALEAPPLVGPGVLALRRGLRLFGVKGESNREERDRSNVRNTSLKTNRFGLKLMIENCQKCTPNQTTIQKTMNSPRTKLRAPTLTCCAVRVASARASATAVVSDVRS